MFSFASVASLGYCLLLVVFLKSLYLVVWRFWWGETGKKPSVHYRKDSRVCEAIVQACSTLTERYTPPLLWGSSAFMQTLFFGVIGRFYVPQSLPGERHSVTVPDGSTVLYDFYSPTEALSAPNMIYIVVPGIGNCSESDYIRAFVHYATSNHYHVAVLNHVGALKDSPLTGNRLFTYGGTGDLAAMFEDLLSRHPTSQYVLVGFSLGANIVVRFVGERAAWRKHFVCAISVGQGYDPDKAIGSISKVSLLTKLCARRIVTQLLALIRRHQDNLLGDTAHQRLRDPSRRHSDVTHGGRDCNGFALDPNKILPPNKELLWKANSIQEIDEHYTRRVMGFESVRDMWQWMGCVEMMRRVIDFPLLMVNSCDDPVIHPKLHAIPIEHTDCNPYAMFVSTEYGGHLGFFEGGIIRPNDVTWVDRLILQYSKACSKIVPKFCKSKATIIENGH